MDDSIYLFIFLSSFTSRALFFVLKLGYIVKLLKSLEYFVCFHEVSGVELSNNR